MEADVDRTTFKALGNLEPQDRFGARVAFEIGAAPPRLSIP
jgi:hypothetical protein